MNEMNEQALRDQTQGEAIDDGAPVATTRDLEQPLTTKDVASGVAARRAREEPREAVDVKSASTSQNSAAPSPHETDRREPAKSVSPLFESTETETFRSRWHAIQTQFVDEPRRSVEQADELVAATMKRLAEVFASERENLERDWDRGEDISTEELRIALQRYRSFFDRLLSI
jgi:hypothetical protein